MSSPSPLFLVGATRSGTTLLSLMLDHHPDISFPGEFDLCVEQVPAPGVYPSLPEYYDWLSMSRHFRAHQLEVDPSLGYRDLMRSFLRQMQENAGGEHKAIVGAAVHQRFDCLLELWPEARFVHIVRDPRDVATSWIERGWSGNVWFASQTWQELEQLWDRVAGEIPPNRVFEIRFEDLIRETTRVLTELCAFIGVPYSSAMLSYPSATTYGPIDPAQAFKWRTRLTSFEQRLADAALGEILERRGYLRSGLPSLRVGSVTKLRLRVQDRVSRLRTRIRRWGLGLWLGGKITGWLRLRGLNRRIELRRQALVNRQLQ